MATLRINGQRVNVGDEFLQLSPEEQEAAVDEIAQSIGSAGNQPESQTSQDLRNELSGMTRAFDGDPSTRMPGGEQTMGGAATTWLEHGISDLPIVGPYIQQGSDYLGTELYGRLSGQDPAQMREDIRQRRAQRTADYPMSAVSGAIAGNTAAFGGAGATKAGAQALGISGAKLLPRIGNSARTSGAISASDTLARGGSLEEAVGNSVYGAGIGAAIPIVGQAIRSGIGAVGERVGPTFNAFRNAPAEAERRVGMAARRDAAANPGEMFDRADEVMARQAGIPLINADRAGEVTRSLARSAANQSPEARGLIERTANDRFAGQAPRAAAFVSKLTGGAADDIALHNAIRDAAQAANRPAYDAAFKSPAAQGMWHEGFEQLMQAPAMQVAARQATTRGANRAAVEGFTPIRNPFTFGPDGRMKLADPRVLPNLRFWDQTKRNLDSLIGKAQRAGDKAMSSDLMALKSHLVRMTDEAVPEYQAARQGAAAFFGADDAIEAGKKFANTPRLVPEARRAFMAMTAPEKKAFATGYASELIDKIKASRDSHNVINAVFKSQASRDSMEMVFGPQKMRQIEAYVRAESLADRLRGAMGNSTTARQLVEMGLGATGGFAIGGDWKSAAAGAALARAPRQAAQWADNRVMQNIARLLTTDDPRAFERVVQNAALSPKYMQALEALGTAIAAPVRGLAMGAAQ